MGGRWTPIEWNGRRARAWVPEPLAALDLELGTSAARKSEQAATSVRRADELLPGSWEPIARILLRTEGVASSSIEGLRAPIEAVAVGEVDDTAVDRDAAWVADNLMVVATAIRATRRALSTTSLRRWHHQLMRHSNLPPGMIGSPSGTTAWPNCAPTPPPGASSTFSPSTPC